MVLISIPIRNIDGATIVFVTHWQKCMKMVEYFDKVFFKRVRSAIRCQGIDRQLYYRLADPLFQNRQTDRIMLIAMIFTLLTLICPIALPASSLRLNL